MLRRIYGGKSTEDPQEGIAVQFDVLYHLRQKDRESDNVTT